MKPILFYIAYLFYRALRLLVGMPRRPPYAIARLITFVLRRILKYRLKVVQYNIDRCFADRLSTEERGQVIDGFYDHLGKTFVETLYGHEHTAYVLEQIHISHHDALRNILNQGKSVMLIGSHMANWEWMGMGIGALLDGDYPTYGVYKPLTNPYIDHMLRSDRRSLGLSLIALGDTYRTMMERRGQPTIYALACDQRPAPGRDGTKVRFFHDEMAFIDGYVALAKRLDLEVFFVQQRRLPDNTCDIQFVHIPDISRLVATYAQLLEANIRSQPAYWLWSHDRWRRIREGR